MFYGATFADNLLAWLSKDRRQAFLTYDNDCDERFNEDCAGIVLGFDTCLNEHCTAIPVATPGDAACATSAV